MSKCDITRYLSCSLLCITTNKDFIIHTMVSMFGMEGVDFYLLYTKLLFIVQGIPLVLGCNAEIAVCYKFVLYFV